jgi:hypothetical protein
MSLAVIAFPKGLTYSVRAFYLDSRVSGAVALAPASGYIVDAPRANEWSCALEFPQDSAEVGHLRTSLEARVGARDRFGVADPFA